MDDDWTMSPGGGEDQSCKAPWAHKLANESVIKVCCTFCQLLNGGDLLRAIQGVDGPDALRKVHVVGQGAGQIRQQGVKGPEPVRGDGVHYPIEVPVSVAVEADLLGSLLRG